jgi:hypothetical protein
MLSLPKVRVPFPGLRRARPYAPARTVSIVGTWANQIERALEGWRYVRRSYTRNPWGGTTETVAPLCPHAEGHPSIAEALRCAGLNPDAPLHSGG